MGICLSCGKPTNGRRKFCSLKCERKLSYLRWYPKRGAENYRTDRKRRDICFAYDFKCAVCGWGLRETAFIDDEGKLQTTNGCEIHHIVPVKDGGSSDWDNLILLCPNCHKKASIGIYTKDFLKGYIKPLNQPIYMQMMRARNRSDLISKARQISKNRKKWEDLKNEQNLDGGNEP